MMKILPALVFFEEFDNNWIAYLNAIYDFFKKDFIDNSLTID